MSVNYQNKNFYSDNCSLKFNTKFPLAAYSQVVYLALLDLPHIMESTGYAYFTIWGYSQHNNCIWGTKKSGCFLKRLLWISPQPIGLVSPCSCCFPYCLCFPFCIVHREIKFPKTVMAVITMYTLYDYIHSSSL